MTKEEIKDACPSIDSIEWNEAKGKFYYYAEFHCEMDEETHDVAWGKLCDIASELETIGMGHEETWSDNDSIGGFIVPKPSE